MTRRTSHASDDAERRVVALRREILRAAPADGIRVDVHERDFCSAGERLGVGGVQSDAGNVRRHEGREPGVQLMAVEQDAVDSPCEFAREDSARDRLAHEMDVPADAACGQILENAGVAVAPVLVGER